MVTFAALNHALQTAVKAGQQGPRTGGNPQVGAALLDEQGRILSVGYHRGRGSVHAEVECLANIPTDLDPTTLTLVVTLEPCAHHGLTPPCAGLILARGIGAVYYAVADPHQNAAGGAVFLRENGVKVHCLTQEDITPQVYQSALELTAAWRQAIQQERPWTIAKIAQTIDGYVAARDGSSQWITGKLSRAHAHRIRATVDSIVIGTGTALADQPELSARTHDGFLLPHQPRRFVLGERDLPQTMPLMKPVTGWRPADLADEIKENPHLSTAQVCQLAKKRGQTPASQGDERATHYRHRDLKRFLTERFQAGDRFVLIEGGPTLVSAALRAHLVNELHVYQAPKLLGAGRKSLDQLGINSLSQAQVFERVEYQALGSDLWLRLWSGA